MSIINSSGVLLSYREPKCLKDAVILLQNLSGFTFPRTENDWADTPKLSVDIRRNFVVVDILKEARFDELKLLSVNLYFIVVYSCLLGAYIF